MRRMKGAAGLLTALLLAFQLSAQTFALASEDNGIKVVPVNFTHNGYSYEIEGVAKSTDGDYQIKSPARLPPESSHPPMTQEAQERSQQ